MIEFRTLGRLELTRDGAELARILNQPKRLALLAYLAIQPAGQYSRRDGLLAMFWPELDAARARHSLSQALYLLRSELGRDALERRGSEELRLRPGRFWCDAAAFDNAVAAADKVAALELYHGDFLNGVFLTEARPFEQWLELERQRLRESASAAARGLADEREAAGDVADAAAWARRAAALAPYDEVAVQRLIRLLDRSGDRATAVRVYEDFAALLRDELEIEPAPETARLLATVRKRWWAHTIVPGRRADRGAEPTATHAAGERRPAEAHPATPPPAPERARVFRSRWRLSGLAPRVRRTASTALFLMIGSVGVLFWMERDRGAAENLIALSSDEREAQELYLRGRFYRARRDATGVESAIRLLEEAVRLDPQFAAAHAALAEAYAHLGAYTDATEPLLRRRALLTARASASRALAIDPLLADARVAMALHYHWHNWDWDAAEAEYRYAIELDPSNAGAHQWYALFLLDLGRVDEALVHMRQARKLDPLSIVINRNLGYVLYCARQGEEAIAQLATTLDLDPDSPLQHAWLRNAYLMIGAEDDAFAAQLRHAELRGWSPEALERLRAAYSDRGWQGAWGQLLEQAQARGSTQPPAPAVLARLNAALGRFDSAFDWLERAYRERAIELLRLKVDPIYDGLRADPRYHDLLARMGLD